MLEEKGDVPNCERNGKQILPNQVEHAVAKIVKKMRQGGISVSNDEIRKIAFKVATKTTDHGVRPETFRAWAAKEAAGISWLKGFLRRNKRHLDENPTESDDGEMSDGTVVSEGSSQDDQNSSSIERNDKNGMYITSVFK